VAIAVACVLLAKMFICPSVFSDSSVPHEFCGLCIMPSKAAKTRTAAVAKAHHRPRAGLRQRQKYQQAAEARDSVVSVLAEYLAST